MEINLHKILRQPTVCIESPFAALHGKDMLPTSTIADHVLYARRALLHQYKTGRAPVASHLLGPQALDDGQQESRDMGMVAGHRFLLVCDVVAFYVDYGMTGGMQRALDLVNAYNSRLGEEGNAIQVEIHSIGTNKAEGSDPHQLFIHPEFRGQA